MADSTIKPDSGNDLVLQNNGGTGKIEVNDGGDVEITPSTSLKVTLGSDSGDDFAVDTDKLVVEGDTGSVGVGVSDPIAKFEVEDGGTSKTVIMKVTSDDQNPYGLIVGNDTYSTTDSNGFAFTQRNDGEAKVSNTGTTAITIDTSSNVSLDAGNLVIGTAGKGIDFSNAGGSASGSSSAILDDYEQGTVVQYLNVGGSNVSTTIMNSLTNEGYTYTKIGNVCTVACRFSTNVGVSQADIGTGTILINLPFTSNSTCQIQGPAQLYEGGGSGWIGNGRFRISNSQSVTNIYTDANMSSAFQASTTAERYIIFTATYIVA
tara:strand:+ start:136 stop:1092 length:957 start_codon:yes stop_codon:yes gene_type:complete